MPCPLLAQPLLCTSGSLCPHFPAKGVLQLVDAEAGGTSTGIPFACACMHKSSTCMWNPSKFTASNLSPESRRKNTETASSVEIGPSLKLGLVLQIGFVNRPDVSCRVSATPYHAAHPAFPGGLGEDIQGTGAEQRIRVAEAEDFPVRCCHAKVCDLRKRLNVDS